MNNPNKDSSQIDLKAEGYISVENFIDFHEKLAELLKIKYDELKIGLKDNDELLNKFPSFKQEDVLIKEGVTKNFTFLPIWIYRKEQKPFEEFVTIDDLYTSNNSVEKFKKQYSRKYIKETSSEKKQKFYFGRHIYEMRLRLIRSKSKHQIAEVRKTVDFSDDSKYIYGFFLLTEPKLTYQKIFSKYWINKNKVVLLDEKSQTEIQSLRSQYNNFNHYIGFYFSEISFKVRHFFLKISKEEYNGNYFASQQGFHNRNGFSFKTPINGNAEIQGGYLSIKFIDNEGHDFNVMGRIHEEFITHEEEITQPIIKVNIQGVSTLGNIINKNSILVKCTEVDIKNIRNLKRVYYNTYSKHISSLTKNDFLTILLYLCINAPRYSALPTAVKNIRDLQIKGQDAINYRYLKGTYRVWNYGLGSPGKVIQSKIIINEDGTARFVPFIQESKIKSKNLKHQNGIIHISNINSDESVICLVTLEKTNIINVAFFEYPNSQENQVIEGTFISVGYTEKKKEGILSGYIVMEKTEKEFKTWEKINEEINDYAEKEDLKHLLKALKKHWLRKVGIHLPQKKYNF